MRYVLVLAALLAATLVFACGDDDDDNDALGDVCTETEGAIGEDVVDLTSPEEGDELESPLTVSGTANVTGGQFFIAVVAADGDHIIDYPVPVQSDGSFSATVPFSVFEETPACLWILEQNLAEPGDAMRIPLTLVPGATEAAE